MIALALAVLLAASPEPSLPEMPPARVLDAPDPARVSRDPESVYRVGALDLGVTSLALALAIAPGRLTGPIIRPSCPCQRESVNVLDRFAIDLHDRTAGITSDVTAGLAVAVPVIADAIWVGFSPALREDLIVLTETLSVNAGLVMAVKYMVQRPLPATYAGRDGLVGQFQGYRSFYSGHTSTTVAALTAAAWTLQLRRGPSAWPWVVTGAVGASVAVERVLAGRHWPTDVLVGAAAGFGVGTLVPWLHARRPVWKRSELTLAPAPAGRGLALRVKF